LGLTPESPQLRILTTTASLDRNQQGRDFLREFFGRDNFAFITGQQTPPTPGARFNLSTYQNAFAQFAQSVQADRLQEMQPPNSALIKCGMLCLIWLCSLDNRQDLD
jgi:hypothetical protein